MILIKGLFMIIIGVCAGSLVAAGLFTLITSLGLVNRLADVTRSAKYVHYYENCIVLGATGGALFHGFAWPFHVGGTGMVIMGLFSGIFIGCFIASIAEILDAFPIFMRRLKLKTALKGVVYSLAFGKLLGVLIQYFILFNN